ncbi:hypothetical protein BU26DRAFT_603860 [Trematosphaeria pertusa]|uniref:Zn(2)-C6 fungal-type domain-containing protein n=1 Tax=Trematosphaeria pertusa TaxID=390896 RepID=A0A6A6IMJ2_9PLEO|nr:uncharacterized protein BU26DRAFT_603860 [Trematosphaeria pertusa]KAF2251447.1 hypothetical protein BU26DRAFT_603860 [Trematosphaeria pertusa]
MPRRTKACATCRQKRIKCDATLPHCIMCKRFGRECPGVTDAPLLFIDNSSYPSGKKPRRKKPGSQSESTPAGPVGWEVMGYGHAGRGLPEELAFVMLSQVSPRYVLNEAFFANLVCYFCAEGRHIPGSVRRTPSWLHILPRMAASGAPSPASNSNGANALGLALRATTAAFSGIETRNQGLLQYAYGLYGAALQSQGHVLQAKGPKGVGMNMVAASVMLSMFEAVVATTGQAYAEHIVGASKMMEVALLQVPAEREGAPPGGASGGGGPGPLLTNLFFHVRFQLAFVYLTSQEGRVRRDECIKRVLMGACGWRKEELPLMQRLVGCIGSLAEIYFDASPSPTTATRARKRRAGSEAYIRAKEEVDTLWQDYEPMIKRQRLCWTNPETGHTDFRDPFTALNFAYFSAARILLSLVSTNPDPAPPSHIPPSLSSKSGSTSKTSPALSSSTVPASSTPVSSSPDSPDSVAADHHALILDVAWFLRLRDVGFSYLRLHVPLFVVALHAPREEQRRVARMIFSEWKNGQLRGIGSLGMLGLEGPHEAREVEVEVRGGDRRFNISSSL